MAAGSSVVTVVTPPPPTVALGRPFNVTIKITALGEAAYHALSWRYQQPSSPYPLTSDTPGLGVGADRLQSVVVIGPTDPATCRLLGPNPLFPTHCDGKQLAGGQSFVFTARLFGRSQLGPDSARLTPRASWIDSQGNLQTWVGAPVTLAWLVVPNANPVKQGPSSVLLVHGFNSPDNKMNEAEMAIRALLPGARAFDPNSPPDFPTASNPNAVPHVVQVALSCPDANGVSREFKDNDHPGSCSPKEGGHTGIMANSKWVLLAANLMGAQKRKVLVLTHSKGGLDTRAAVSQRPWLFRAVGQAAPPNAGATSADNACGILDENYATGASYWRAPQQNVAINEFGGCSTASALWDMRTASMAAYNADHPDPPDVPVFVAAGNCSNCGFSYSGIRLVGSGPDCAKEATLASNYVRDRWGGQKDDGAVCPVSAFAALRSHTPIEPIYGRNHSDMAKTCPVSNLLGHVGAGQVRLPNVDGLTPWQKMAALSAYCLPAEEPVGPPGKFVRRSALSSNALPWTNAPADLADPLAGLQAATQPPVVALASSLVPARLTIDPEGGPGARVEIWTSGSSVPDISVEDSAGNPVTSGVQLAAGPVSMEFGVKRWGLSISTPTGQPVAIVVSPTAGTITGDTLVVAFPEVAADGVRLSISATPFGAGQVRLDATINGLSAATVVGYAVNASFTLPTGQSRLVALAPNGFSSTGDPKYSATVAVPLGQVLSVRAKTTGAKVRVAQTHVRIAQSLGSIGLVQSSSLVDTNADGSPDFLRVVVPVNAPVSGEYSLSASLKSGVDLVAAPFEVAPLPAGPGEITLQVAVRSLIASGKSGPYEVTDATLTQGDAMDLVDKRAILGQTTPITLGQLSPPTDELVITKPVAQTMDVNTDGRPDHLQYSSNATVPAAGEYLLQGAIYGPAGDVVDQFSRTLTLTAGINQIGWVFDGNDVFQGGNGRYYLDGFLLTQMDPDGVDGRSVPSEPVDVTNASQWPPLPSGVLSIVAQSPTNGAIYPQSSFVTAAFACQELTESNPDSTVVSPAASCTAPLPSGGAIDTSTPGAKTFTITATGQGGLTTQKTITYTVAPQIRVGAGVEASGKIIPGGITSDPTDQLPKLNRTSKADISYEAKPKSKSSTRVEGELEFEYERGSIHLHSTTLTSLVVTADNWAESFGTGKIEGKTGTYTFRIRAYDGTPTNTTDRITIVIWTPGANPATASPAYQASGNLTSGNIKIEVKP